ncbi:MAG: HisA/HisF-related TIM barrel protein, partial [Cyclobacteriaceae bacterium]
PNFGLYKKLMKKFPDLKIIASGGVSSIDDLKELKHIKVFGAIVGKAIYEGHIQLNQLKNL